MRSLIEKEALHTLNDLFDKCPPPSFVSSYESNTWTMLQGYRKSLKAAVEAGGSFNAAEWQRRFTSLKNNQNKLPNALPAIEAAGKGFGWVIRNLLVPMARPLFERALQTH